MNPWSRERWQDFPGSSHYFNDPRAGGIRVSEIGDGRTGVVLGDGSPVRVFKTFQEARQFVEAVVALRS